MATEYRVQATDIQAVADAIREKAGTTDAMVFPDGFVEAVSGISAGGSGGELDALIGRSITEITNNAETIGAYAFADCNELKIANFPNAVTIGEYAFYTTQIEKKVVLEGNFPKVKTIGVYAFAAETTGEMRLLEVANFPLCEHIGDYAFYKNLYLREIYFPNALTIGKYAFSSNQGAVPIITADFPKATSLGESAFEKCKELTTINIPLVSSLGKYAFNGCNSLKVVDFPSYEGSFTNWMFRNCKSLVSIILRRETMNGLSATSAFDGCSHILGTVDATYNPNGLKDGYIYVPRALIEDYKVATNWVTFADQFRALEDYTVDGTTTGELDESKI